MLSVLPAKDSLLVLTYHRIGDHENDPFDPGIFSATGDQFDEQISDLKRNHSLVTLEEALEFVDGTIKEKACRCRVLITFDDGYMKMLVDRWIDLATELSNLRLKRDRT